jgi:hypothetical protein
MRAISNRTPANLVVSWCGVEAMIAGLRVPVAGAGSEAIQSVTGGSDPAMAELERVLAQHPSVAQCAAMMRKDRTGTDRTVCYVVFKRGEQTTVSDLRRFVKAGLSGTRRAPSNFVPLDAIPRVAAAGGNGGTAADYALLPDPFGVSDTFVAPRTPTETTLAQAWIEALGVSRVSIHDNFFDIGGHSLLAVRVVTKVDKLLGVRLSQAIMVLQTLEQIAAECDRQKQPR